jgi:hypothetical protein
MLIDLDNILLADNPANLDVLQYNLSTGLWLTTTTITGITLASPWTLVGNGAWNGLSSTWDITGGLNEPKIIKFGESLSFRDENSKTWFDLSPVSNKILLGNADTNPTFDFLGTGLASFGGPMNVTGLVTLTDDIEFVGSGTIGLTTAPQLIELSTTTRVNINANLFCGSVQSTFAGNSILKRETDSTGTSLRVLQIIRDLGATSVDSDGSELRFQRVTNSATKNLFNISAVQDGATANADSRVELSIYDNNVKTLRIMSDQLGTRLTSNVRIGDTIAPTETFELALATEDAKFVDAGSVSATEQDWIEVKVGGNTGYIRIYASK